MRFAASMRLKPQGSDMIDLKELRGVAHELGEVHSAEDGALVYAAADRIEELCRKLAQARAQVERAADIIDGLLAFDLGSAERAVNFLAERDGSHPFSSTERSNADL
jgi:hypothetical protein